MLWSYQSSGLKWSDNDSFTHGMACFLYDAMFSVNSPLNIIHSSQNLLFIILSSPDIHVLLILFFSPVFASV